MSLYKTGAFLRSALFLLCISTAGTVSAQVNVRVATEPWDQIVYLDDAGKPKGAIADFVRKMNGVQSKFHFELNVYPRLRLDTVFMDKEADVYPLRTTVWTNPALGLLPTKTILSSGDVYFAKRNNRFGGAKVFDNLAKKNIAGVRGYHYQIFNNNSDENYIKNNFNAYLVATNKAVVQFVMAGRADVGVVPEVILAKYLADPEMRRQIIVSDKFDSRVELSNLVRRDGPISVKEMDAIIDLLSASGALAELRASLSGRQDAVVKK